MADNDNGMAFVSGFLLGGLVGAAVGMLLAPKSGAETRAGIAEQSDVWKHRAEDFAGQVSHNISPTIDSLRHQVAPAVDVVREKMGMEPASPPAEQEMASANGANGADADSGSEKASADSEEEAAPASKAS